MGNKTYSVPSLSRRELSLISSWEKEHRTRLRLEELRQMLGDPAEWVAHRLTRKGVLQRVSRGVYLIRPVRTLDRPSVSSAAAALSFLLEEQPYYLGGLWALSLHRLTSQAYASAVDAYVLRRRRSRVVLNARVTFHALPPKAFAYGITGIMIEGAQVQVSDPERTVLDLLDHSRTAGDLRTAVRQVAAALARVRAKTLVEYAAKASRTSTCQRLAVLLERAGIGAKVLRPLERRTGRTRTVLSMIEGEPRKGHLNARWRVVENDR
jgi:predicted transcriptional regulator of viral defense system